MRHEETTIRHHIDRHLDGSTDGYLGRLNSGQGVQPVDPPVKIHHPWIIKQIGSGEKIGSCQPW